MLKILNKYLHKKRTWCSLFVFLAGLFYTTFAKAQHFTSCFNYEVGSVNEYKQVHTFYTDFIIEELNKHGSDEIWNLHDSDIVYYAAVAIQEIVPATMVYGYNNFVEANIVRKFPDDYNQFLLQDSSGIRLVGRMLYSEVEKYNNKKTLINYPHGLFECSVDSFSIDSIEDVWGGWFTENKGTSQNCFDAEGEIHFKSGLIVPTYRYTRIDTLRYLSNGLPGMLVEMETYWYESECNLHTPIIYARGHQGVNGYQHYNRIYILKEYALGMNEELNGNEAHFNFKVNLDELIISSTNNLSQTISLIDLTGKLIYEKLLGPKQNSISFSTIQLSTGVYFLKSSTGEGYKISILH